MNNEFKPVDTHKYDDIINLPHHISKKHPQMSLYQRSAQFAPFAALTGYEDAIYETSRITEERIELDEEVKMIINEKLNKIKNNIQNTPKVVFTYFIPDFKKNGGKYVTITDNIIKIDEYKRIIILADKTEIPIFDIIDIEYDEIKK